MEDDRVTRREVGYTGADGFDKAGVFVAQREWQLLAHVGEDAFHQMEVRPAHAGASNADDDVRWAGDLRLGPLLHARWLVKREQLYRFHGLLSTP
jgi:hypothetical protein